MSYELGKACSNNHIDDYENDGSRTTKYYDACAEICKECGEDLRKCVINVTEVGFHKINKEIHKFKE